MDGTEYLKYLKYVTESVVTYMDAEAEEEAKPIKKLSREPWLTRWFGVLPMGFMMWWANRADKKNRTHPEVRSVNSSNYR
jgi:hypothetical protein